MRLILRVDQIGSTLCRIVAVNSWTTPPSHTLERRSTTKKLRLSSVWQFNDILITIKYENTMDTLRLKPAPAIF